MKGFPPKSRSVYRRYFITYCCIALIPVFAVICALALITDSNHTNTARDLYRRAITQTASHIDAIVQDMQASVSYFAANEYINNLLAAQDEPARLAEVVEKYLTTVEENSRISIRTLYYSVGETQVYTATGTMPYKELEDELSREANLTMSSFFTRLNTITAMKAWLLQPAAGENPAYHSAIAFAFPTFNATASKRGTFVFLVDMEDVLGIITEYLGVKPDYLYLYAANYDWIGAFEAEIQTPEVRGKLLQSNVNAVEEARLGTRNYQVLRYKTDLFGFHIITCVRLSQLYGDQQSLRTSMLLIGLAVMLVAGAVAILLANYSYRPIRMLLNSIGQEAQSKEGLEFERIDHHLTHMNAEMMELQARLSMQRPMVRDRVMLGLLRGTLDENGQEQLRSVFADAQLEDRFCYVALLAADGKALLNQHLLLEKPDLAGADCYGVYLEDESLFALLIVTADATDRRLQHCIQLLQLLEPCNIPSPRISAGKLVEGVSNVPTSYLEAFIAMNGRMSAGGQGDVFLYSEEAFPNKNGAWLTDGGAASIYMQSVRSVDRKTALALLETLHEAMEFNCNSMLNVSYMRFELFSKTIAVCEPTVAQAFSKNMVSVEILPDAARFWELMRKITIANCQAVEERRNDAQCETRQLILHAVHTRCCQPDFSLSCLSALVGYSATYINRCLREETGYSFIQLTSMLRIARAKDELLFSDCKIKDIVEHVGYLDMASFTRKFKEMEGVTPGEYRVINGKSI